MAPSASKLLKRSKAENKVFYSAGAGESKEEIEQKATFEALFEQANLNLNANLIKGVICGYRIEENETQNETKVKLKGKGFPVYKVEGEFGDLILTYRIKIPTNLSEKEKELFQELQKIR